MISLAGGAAGLLVGRVGHAKSPKGTRSIDPRPPGPVMRELSIPPAPAALRSALGGLEPGLRLGDWTVVAIHALHYGGIPVVLEDATGDRFQIDVLRRDEQRPAVAETAHLSFFLANGGDGAKASAESQGLAARALAEYVGDREAPEGLLTHAERAARHVGAGFSVPVRVA